MVEMLVLWILGLIVIAIAWGGIDRIVVPFKMFRQWFQPSRLSRRSEVIVASFLGIVVVSTIVAITDQGVSNIRQWVSLPAFVVWAGGLWLIPIRFHVLGYYWPFTFATAVMLVVFWIGNTSHAPIQRPMQRQVQTEVSTQQRQDIPTRVSSLGFLLWIFLIGLTVSIIARYTSTWNAVVHTS